MNIELNSFVVLSAAALVLLSIVAAAIAVAGSVLYRSTLLRTEVATRRTLGARRSDIVRMFLSENVLGIAAGLAIGASRRTRGRLDHLDQQRGLADRGGIDRRLDRRSLRREDAGQSQRTLPDDSGHLASKAQARGDFDLDQSAGPSQLCTPTAVQVGYGACTNSSLTFTKAHSASARTASPNRAKSRRRRVSSSHHHAPKAARDATLRRHVRLRGS